jgi:hypothetical protein
LERDDSPGSYSRKSFVESPDRSGLYFMSRPKSKTSSFAFVRSLLGKADSTPVELKVEQRKADEGVLDRVASLNLSIAEHFAPLAVSTQDPNLVNAVLGASREARACVEARKEVTGGGLAGGTTSTTSSTVTVLIEHQGLPVSDDFNADIAATNADLAVQARS